MTSIMKIKFEKLLTRKDFDNLITECSPYNKAMIIRPFLIKYVERDDIHAVNTACQHRWRDDDNYYYTIVSKLYYDSLQALHEDSIELLKLKHKDKFNYFQTNKAIEEFLPQIYCLIRPQKDVMTESDAETTESETATPKAVVKKVVDKKKKVSSKKSNSDDDKKFIAKFHEEYAPVDEDLLDDDEINKVFFN